MEKMHVYSNRHIKAQVPRITKGDTIVLENKLSRKLWSLYFRYNNIDESKLQINYVAQEKYLSLKTNKFNSKNLVIVGNPPYVDGTEGESNIYHKIVGKGLSLTPQSQVWIIPTSWFLSTTSEHSFLREKLFESGLKEITLNPMDTFDNASVKTCTIVCEHGYEGKVKVQTNKGKYFIDPNNRGQHILPVDNDIAVNLLNRIVDDQPYKFLSGKHSTSPRKAHKEAKYLKTETSTHAYPIVIKLAKNENDIEYVYGDTNEDIDSDKYRIALPYLATGYASGDMKLGAVGVISPKVQLCGYYKYLIVNSKSEAITLQKYLMSKFVRYILHYTRTSRTLDAPQVRFIPKFNTINVDLTDKDIYKHFNLSQKEIQEIESCSLTWTS